MEKQAVKIADGIGFPVMIKASAGGGARGCGFAHSTSEVAEGFGLPRPKPRRRSADDRFSSRSHRRSPHIGIRCSADKHGNVIYLGERECSIQRPQSEGDRGSAVAAARRDHRARWAKQAVALAKAVNYDSAARSEICCRAGQKLLSS